MVLGLKPIGKPTTWMRKTRFWTESRHCVVLGLKPMGKPTTWMRKTRFWTEPRHCMVLGLKPIIYGSGPFTRGESKSPSRGGLWPKLNNIKHKIVLGYSRGQFSPRQTQNPTEKRGKNGIGLSLKENLTISRESCPHCHSMLCT